MVSSSRKHVHENVDTYRLVFYGINLKILGEVTKFSTKHVFDEMSCIDVRGQMVQDTVFNSTLNHQIISL